MAVVQAIWFLLCFVCLLCCWSVMALSMQQLNAVPMNDLIHSMNLMVPLKALLAGRLTAENHSNNRETLLLQKNLIALTVFTFSHFKSCSLSLSLVHTHAFIFLISWRIELVYSSASPFIFYTHFIKTVIQPFLPSHHHIILRTDVFPSSFKSLYEICNFLDKICLTRSC